MQPAVPASAPVKRKAALIPFASLNSSAAAMAPPVRKAILRIAASASLKYCRPVLTMTGLRISASGSVI